MPYYRNLGVECNRQAKAQSYHVVSCPPGYLQTKGPPQLTLSHYITSSQPRMRCQHALSCIVACSWLSSRPWNGLAMVNFHAGDAHPFVPFLEWSFELSLTLEPICRYTNSRAAIRIIDLGLAHPTLGPLGGRGRTRQKHKVGLFT